MTATIAAEMGETVHASPHYHALFFLGLLLFGITFAINTVSEVSACRCSELWSTMLLIAAKIFGTSYR